jgi:hypothetical protein
MAEPPKPPAIADLVQPPGPVFLRKMNKKTDWGSDETPPDERVSDIIDAVFGRKTYPYSVYLVQSDEELHRVIIGMNGGRESLTAESHFVAIHGHELEASRIRVDHTPAAGMTSCRFANSLHHDLAAENAQLKALCLRLIAAGRKATTFTKGRTRVILPGAEAIGCLAIPESKGCTAERCA